MAHTMVVSVHATVDMRVRTMAGAWGSRYNGGYLNYGGNGTCGGLDKGLSLIPI